MKKIGFIGTGTMGSAVAEVVTKANKDATFYFSNRRKEKAEAVAAALGGTCVDNLRIAQDCDWIFLGVKPQILPGVLEELAPVLQQRESKPILLSMAAGVTVASVAEMAGGAYPIIRMMPNTPLQVGQGVVQYCGTAEEAEMAEFARWMAGAGIVDCIPEAMIDAASAVSGSGPAYCAMFIEAMADSGVYCGLPREKALAYAAQTMLGTGAMMMESGIHPAMVKDDVCSPGGSTIRGVSAMEEGGLRSAVMKGIQEAFARNRELGEK